MPEFKRGVVGNLPVWLIGAREALSIVPLAQIVFLSGGDSVIYGHTSERGL